MPKIHDMTNIEIEHLLGVHTDCGIVQARISLVGGDVVLTQMTPAIAKKIGGDLIEAAARADYEGDLGRGAKEFGMDKPMIARLITIVRRGERARCEHTPIEGDPHAG